MTIHLWYLHELNIADKHRHLLLVRRTLGQQVRVSWDTAKPVGNVPKAAYAAAPVEDGSVFLRIERVPGVDVKVNPTIQIFFSNGPPSLRTDLPVENILDLVESSVWEVFSRLKSHVE